MKKILFLPLLTVVLNNLNAQHIGIGTVSPAALLHVADSNVLFTGPVILLPGSQTSYNPPLQGAGTRMMWYPQKAALRAGFVDGSQWNKPNTGLFSFATGFNTVASNEGAFAAGGINTASGQYATATGFTNVASGGSSFAAGAQTLASGEYATTTGYNNIASGNFAAAFGNSTSASGFSSVAMGRFTKARSASSLVTGEYNDTSAVNSLFEIGNGTAENARNNVLTVLNNGNTGIGIISPVARLQVADSNVVFTGPLALPLNTSFSPPAEGAGSRMMWYAQKAAFRAGIVDDNQWNKFNTGRYSFATGYNTIASDEGSFAAGYRSMATGTFSVAMGYNSVAGADYAVALGPSSLATGSSAIALGMSSKASGGNSVALGQGATASGINSLAAGYASSASGENAVALGYYNIAAGKNAVAAGTVTKVYGDNAFGTGYYTKAKWNNSFVAGMFNDTITAAQNLFIIGNGTADNNRNNAFTVTADGKTGIGIKDPVSLLHVGNGSVRIEGPASPGTASSLSLGGYGDIIIDAPGFPGGRLSITENGNIGIGNTNPGRKLSFGAVTGEKIQLLQGVSGEYGIGVYPAELRLHSDVPGSFISFGTQNNAGIFSELGRFQGVSGFAMSLYGLLWVNGTVYSSDERFKTNIAPLQSPLQKLLKINGVEYDMKTGEFPERNFKPGKQMGLLAQNVEEIVPEAVSELNGYKGVDYARLVPLLIESIKEQQSQIGELKKSIQQLNRN